VSADHDHADADSCPGSGDGHDLRVQGPAAVRGSAGTEVWVIRTCAVDGCDAWDRKPLYANHEVNTGGESGDISPQNAALAFGLGVLLVAVLLGMGYLKAQGVLP